MGSLIHPRERLYFGICVAVSALVYVLLAAAGGALYLLLGAVIVVLARELSTAALKGNGVRVTERQFPEVRRLVERLSLQLGLPRRPDVYVVKSYGPLSAVAAHFLGRNLVVVSADVVELAFADGEPALGFIVAHELAHSKRRHAAVRPLLLPAMAVPLLGSAYARACEYTCDAMGAHCRPDGAADGLRMLCAGTKLYDAVDVKELVRQAHGNADVWTRLAELLASRPFLSKRLAALPEMARFAGVTRPRAAAAGPLRKGDLAAGPLSVR